MGRLGRLAGRCGGAVRTGLARLLGRPGVPGGDAEPAGAAFVDHAGDPAAWARRHLRVSPAGMLEADRREVRAAFPPDRLGELRDTVRREFPESVDRVVARAGAAAAKTFSLLGAGPWTFEGEIDFSSDLAGRSWLTGPIHELRAALYANFPHNEHVIGDVKVPWELNKHLHFQDLARAWVLTGEDGWAEAVRSQLESWWRQNPAGRNLAWCEPLIVAQRAIAWVFAMRFLIHARAIDGPLYLRYLAGLYDHLTFLHDRYEIGAPSSNHLWGELSAALVVTAAHPAFDVAGECRARAVELLAGEADSQVYADGVHFEQSVSYQRYVLQFTLAAEIAARHAAQRLPPSVTSAGHRMARHLMHVISPNGQANLLSDADGAFVYKFDSRGANDYRPDLCLAAAVFGDGELAFAGRGCGEAVCWLLGPGAAVPEPLKPPGRSAYFERGGRVVMRSGWDGAAGHLTFDCGDIGMGYADEADHATHGHDDLLSITLSSRGRQLLIDPGSGAYTGDLKLHDLLRRSQAHNTVCLSPPDPGRPGPPESHSVLGGPWALSQRARPVRPQALLTEEADLALAGQDGYRRFAGSPLHRRAVVYFRPDLWIVLDSIEPQAPPGEALRFAWLCPLVFHPDCRVRTLPGGFLARTGDAHLRGDLVAAGGAGGPAACGPIVGEFPYAEDYGRVVPTARLEFSAVVELPFRSVLVLRAGEGEPPAAEVRPLGGAEPMFGFHVASGETTCRVLLAPIAPGAPPPAPELLVQQLDGRAVRRSWALPNAEVR